ncbi:hypothetical protein NX801_02740 [Streptomyces sp. LP05-1]|uniref:ATP-binding protein n=1 Tax=Streptomyces pyxinae TaxID=2970734 RepID=A0ABT2CB54_9ACTN|nr:hypothetical protein [Streptomyces sp. LP05-1]MCS0634596.1 hypothetical protein [Streptomyces sp. LP05-1]
MMLTLHSEDASTADARALTGEYVSEHCPAADLEGVRLVVGELVGEAERNSGGWRLAVWAERELVRVRIEGADGTDGTEDAENADRPEGPQGSGSAARSRPRGGGAGVPGLRLALCSADRLTFSAAPDGRRLDAVWEYPAEAGPRRGTEHPSGARAPAPGPVRTLIPRPRRR